MLTAANLVLVEPERLADRRRGRLPRLEDALALRVQQPFANKSRHRPARSEVGVELKQRLRPEQARSQRFVTDGSKTLVADVDEAADVRAEPLD